MKYFFFLLVIVAGGYFFPQIAESKGGPCQALEARITKSIGAQDNGAGVIAGLVSGISDGELGRRIALREYPDLPASLACSWGYYALDLEEIRF